MAVPPHTDPASTVVPPQTIKGLASRILDGAKKLVTITENLKALEKEDARIQVQITELGRYVIDLVKEVRELSGQMKGIEKRLDDKDKMVEAIIALKIKEEMEKVRLENRKGEHSGES